LHIPKPEICEASEQLRHAVIQALGLPNDAEWSPMPMGKTNHVWRADIPGTCLVVKWFTGQATPLFANDPFAEFACLSRFGGYLAPLPVLFLSGSYGRAIVYHFLSGPTWAKDVASVGRLLRDVHDRRHVPGLRARASGSEAMLASAEAILSACRDVPVRMRNALKRLADAPKVTPLNATDLRLLHGDPVAANIVETPDGLRLIDWQSPGLGEPCEDLAVFLSPSMQLEYRGAILTDEQSESFLLAYGDPIAWARYLRLRPFLHLRFAAYALWGLERGRNQHAQGMDAELDALDQSLGW